MVADPTNSTVVINNLSVAYGAIKALNSVSLSIPPGQIVGLVGHNGAGKSTLVNAITGAVKPSSGEIRIDGELVDYTHKSSPLYMARLGMKVIHQEPSLIGILSVADNITFRTQGEKRSRKERIEIAREALKRVGSSLDPQKPVASLDFGDRQIVDLARSLLGNVKTLLLDEPTAALGREETERLHRLLQDLSREGKAIVYVSHRLRDILEICDRIVVLREGKVVMDQTNREITADTLSEAVCPNVEGSADTAQGLENRRGEILKALWRGKSYSFCSGEIVGLFGMAGGPQFDFVKQLYGLGTETLEITLEGESCRVQNPREAMKRGICYVSADRERESLFHYRSARSNLCIPWLNRLSFWGLVSKRKMKEEYEKVRGFLNILGPSQDATIDKFSGGNRQKHVLGRWLMNTAGIKLLLLCQPNQGVDIRARADIAQALQKARERGLTILVASSEVDEISHLADRAYVCEAEPWREVKRAPDWEIKLMEALLLGVKRKEVLS